MGKEGGRGARGGVGRRSVSDVGRRSVGRYGSGEKQLLMMMRGMVVRVWPGVARRSAELLGVWAGILVVAVQYVVPGLMNTIVPLEKGNLYLIVEGLCKLAVPNFIIWIMGFYAIFHLQLNLIAEITR